MRRNGATIWGFVNLFNDHARSRQCIGSDRRINCLRKNPCEDLRSWKAALTVDNVLFSYVPPLTSGNYYEQNIGNDWPISNIMPNIPENLVITALHLIGIAHSFICNWQWSKYSTLVFFFIICWCFGSRSRGSFIKYDADYAGRRAFSNIYLAITDFFTSNTNI